MSKNHLITIYPFPVSQKPENKNDFGYFRNRMIKSAASNLEEVLSLLSAPNYYVVSPGIYSDYPTVDSWVKQKLFFLDFDDGTTPEDVKARFNEFNITPNAFYYTFRHKPDAPRFRVVLMLDDFIYNREVAKLIIDSLLIIFPDSDSNCKGLERIYLGGNPFWERVDTPISTIRLIEFLSINLMTRDGNRTRILEEIGEKCHLQLVHIGRGNNSPNTISFPDGKRPNNLNSKNIKNFDFVRCAERVKIFNDFMNHNRENIIVFVDDCDVVFSTEQSLNQMKILLDKDTRTFNYEKSLQSQWGNLSDIQKQAILAHQNDDKIGFSVDCSLMAFVFTSNFKLPNDDMVKIAREKNQGKSLLMAHRNAIRSRCKVADFDLEPSAHWGWIADVVLHTECISDDKMTKDEKIIMLNFIWDNWNELNERSIRLIEKMVETKIQHPESFKLIWEIDHIK
jgi:hypothetical protein